MADKFTKFTERARKVLTLAQEESHRFNHNYIGTEHLLLGLVREEDGVAARALARSGIDLIKVRMAVEFIIGHGDSMNVGQIGLTPRAKKVIELAFVEARRLNHHYIGTEHLLLGLLLESESIAAGVLESLGVELEKARQQVLQVITGQELTGPVPPPVEIRTLAPKGLTIKLPPDPLGELERVIASTHREVDSAVRLDIHSIELYERGMVIVGRLSAEGSLLRPERQAYWEPKHFQAEDDAGGASRSCSISSAWPEPPDTSRSTASDAPHRAPANYGSTPRRRRYP